MAVSKEELLARYKQLKAEGKMVSLMELKKEMEAEASSSTTQQPQVVSTPEQSSSDWTNTYSSNQYQEQNSYSYNQPTPTVEPQSQNIWNTTNQYEYQNSYQQPTTEPTVSTWNNSYSTNNQYSTQNYSYNYEQPAPTPEPTPIPTPMPTPTPTQSPWASNFSNSSYQPTQSQLNSYQSQFIQPTLVQTQMEEKPLQAYCGNMPATIPTQEIESQTKKFCLIGYPLGHSLSKPLHTAGFKSIGVDATYDILETAPEDLVDRIKYLKYNNFSGFNVTIPLKLPITLFLEDVDMSADVVGAVNTVVINPDKTMKGYNTDFIGFKNAIPKDIILAGKNAAVLGTGGAARAAITALAQSQVKNIDIYTRNVPNTIDLLNFLRKKFPYTTFEPLQIERLRDLSNIDILVNTTPIGMLGRSADLTPVEEPELMTLPQGALVYDVIYNPKKTVLLKLAQKHGYRTLNGIDMLIQQGIAAEQIWTGKTPDFKDMKIAVLEEL